MYCVLVSERIGATSLVDVEVEGEFDAQEQTDTANNNAPVQLNMITDNFAGLVIRYTI